MADVFCLLDIGPAARCPPTFLSGTGQALFVVDGGEQRGVGADQRGALQREQRAVGPAALPDPLVGQIHRPHPVYGGGPDHRRGLAEQVAVQAGDRLDQLVARLRGVGRVLAPAVRPPPVDFQAGRLGRVRGLAEAEPDQPVKLTHAGLGTVRVVVGKRRPQLDGPQHQPGARHDPRQVRAEAQPQQPDRSRPADSASGAGSRPPTSGTPGPRCGADRRTGARPQTPCSPTRKSPLPLSSSLSPLARLPGRLGRSQDTTPAKPASHEMRRRRVRRGAGTAPGAGMTSRCPAGCR